MSEPKDKNTQPASEAAAGRLPYEAPGIAWREPYEPVASAVSCAKQPSNPACNPGPFLS